MTAYREQVQSALRAVAVTSPTSYAWFGRRSRPLRPTVAASLAPDSVREVLIHGLQNELYRSFYTFGRPMPVSRNGAPGRTDRALVAALSRNNFGTGGWQSGWRAERVERGTVLIVANGLRARAPVSECRGADRGCRAGELLSVRRPKESPASFPGFYTALGDIQPRGGREGIELRVYFNVCAEGAVPLVATCTRLLNEARIPFDLKVADHAAGFARCDAAVLYLDGGGFERVRELLRTIISTCAPHLHGDPPAFAKPLAPGVAVGEHRPGLGASFGTSRCRLVAEGIVAAHERGARRLPDRIDAVARRFAVQGLDIEAPYLAPGSAGRYEL
jgi:type III HopA1-like effector protein